MCIRDRHHTLSVRQSVAIPSDRAGAFNPGCGKRTDEAGVRRPGGAGSSFYADPWQFNPLLHGKRRLSCRRAADEAGESPDHADCGLTGAQSKKVKRLPYRKNGFTFVMTYARSLFRFFQSVLGGLLPRDPAHRNKRLNRSAAAWIFLIEQIAAADFAGGI